MTIKHVLRLFLVALLAAWVFDQLFWERTAGVSFALMVLLLLVTGLGLAWGEGVRPAWRSLAILLPVGFFAAMSALRTEPLTQFLNYSMSLGMMAVLAVTFAGGGWLRYTFLDHLVNLAVLGVKAVVLPGVAAAKQSSVISDQLSVSADTVRPADIVRPSDQSSGIADEVRPAGEARPDAQLPAGRGQAAVVWGRVLGGLRGVVLAVPLLVVFGALLAGADPVFAEGLEDFFALFKIEKLPEYLFRAFYVAVLGYALAGVYLYALTASRQERVSTDAQQRFAILPLTEASVVLGSVSLLFLAFVLVQFRYFFGGQANINVAGYTYAEYARRGFNELVMVAFFSLLLFIGLSKVTRRTQPAQRWLFAGLGVGLVLLLTIMLVSAFMRLQLYEEAYGFTRLRLYTHVFMIWLGGLLAVLAGIELSGRTRYFALACLLAALGFGATLSLLGVDGFIVHANVARTQRGQALDAAYLATLSPEAVPALARAFGDARLGQDAHDQLGAALACQAARPLYAQPLSWPEFNLGHYRAVILLNGLQGELAAYPLAHTDRGELMVSVNGALQPCYSSEYSWMGD